MKPVYIGLDLGTQSVRAMAVTDAGEVVASAARPLSGKRDGVRHEQEPQQWWTAAAGALQEVSAHSRAHHTIAALAVDATSGTVLVLNAAGEPVTAGLMYDDGRARAEAAEMDERGRTLWQQLSYRIQPAWALAKLLWLVRNGYLASGCKLLHQNDYIHLRLAGRLLPTDTSHALKTGFDTLHGCWPAQVLQGAGIPIDALPAVVPPGRRIGEVDPAAAKATGLPAGTPIISGMTDGCAAQIASGATSVGSWNTVIGTTLVVKGATEQLLHDPTGAVYSHRSMDGLWLPGGASSTGAGAIATNFAPADLVRLNAHAETAEPSPVVVYPLTGHGERFPFVASEAEGFTLGEAATAEERYIAVLQGVALWERLSFDALRALQAPTHGRFTISGGSTRSRALNQLRADIMERELHVAAVAGSAFGMAVLACAAGTSNLQNTTERMVRLGEKITPRRPFSAYAEQYGRLTDELHRRGWLPDSLLRAARAGSRA